MSYNNNQGNNNSNLGNSFNKNSTMAYQLNMNNNSPFMKNPSLNSQVPTPNYFGMQNQANSVNFAQQGGINTINYMSHNPMNTMSNKYNNTAKLTFGKNPFLPMNNNIKDLNDNIKVKDREINNIKNKIKTLVAEIQGLDDELVVYNQNIEKEEAEGERLKHFLNYLMSIQ